MQPRKNNKNTKSAKGNSGLSSLIALVVIAALAFLVFSNAQNIRDWWILKSYQPPSEISLLADQISLNSKSRNIFYVNKPSLTNSNTFTAACSNGSQEKTIVLGCYHGNQKGIYILDVTDPRLNGVEEVTAGHEFLHAAYDRLNSNEKQRVNKLLTDYYATVTDQRIIDTIEAYKISEPNDVVNEMHSIFGTEIANLSPELEQYYKKYFTNRGLIIGFSDKYQSEFTTRKNKIAAADRQLQVYKQQIDSLEAQLKQQLASIQAQDSQMSAYRSSGNIAAYNSMVTPYNNLVYDYNSKINRVQSLIDSYNNLVNQRNNYALEESQLIKSLQPQSQKINN